ncbi:Stf0 family sulfotransferase [Kribbella sp. NPDC051770]|uniref:Stf0 family sulfotransferase n=1 Tax=Kribbella sp. NPDC051770 TaxID=3155413 RepID=UPI00341921D1
MTGYLICSVERTGSTLYSALLEQTGVAGRPVVEPFNMKVQTTAHRYHRFDTFDDYIEFARRKASTPNGVFGINLMWRHMARISREPQLSRTKNKKTCLQILQRHLPGLSHFMFTQRRNTLAQAVSWAIAYQTDRWKSTDPDLGREPSYDFALVDALYQNVLADNLGWETWFKLNEVEPFRIFYEDLAENPSREIFRSLEFLEIPKPAELSPVTHIKKQSTRANQIWCDRYREDKERNNATELPFHWMTDDLV